MCFNQQHSLLFSASQNLLGHGKQLLGPVKDLLTHWSEMSQMASDEVLFCDASVCFSEEEWKLLQEWQKELYGNVMKEIHQALMSLGPLIATTVFSLRAKEKQELCSMDMQISERSQASDMITNIDPISCVKREKKQHLSHPKDTEASNMINNNNPISRVKREENQRLSHPRNTEEEPISIFIDPPGEEVEESNTDPNTGTGQEIISLFIKDEEETYCIYRPESKRRKGSASPTGEGGRNRKRRPIYSVASSEECSPLPGDTKVNTFKNPGIRIDTRSPMQTVNNQDPGQEKSVECENEMFPEHSEFEQSPINVQRSEKSSDIDTNLWNENILKGQLNSQINFEALFGTKHLRTHEVERPYHCIECEKSFILRHHLIQHQRTHTGERPYQCTECHKRFSLKGNLNKHQKTHVITYETNQLRGAVHMGNPN